MTSNGRGWLKFAGYLVVADALFTLIIGLDLWIVTLTTKEELFDIWVAQPATVQDMLQTTVSLALLHTKEERSTDMKIVCMLRLLQ
jgi:hypothetical protein